MLGFLHSLSVWLIWQMNGTPGDKRSYTDLISHAKNQDTLSSDEKNYALFVCLFVYTPLCFTKGFKAAYKDAENSAR